MEMPTVSKRRKHLKRIGFQKKCAAVEDTEIADTEVVDVIVVDSSDDDIAELIGFEGDDPEEEDVIFLEIEDGEEDALTLFNGIISDVMNAMICKLEGSTFISHFKQPVETAVLQSFLRNGGSKSQVNKKLAGNLELKRAAKKHSRDIRNYFSVDDGEEDAGGSDGDIDKIIPKNSDYVETEESREHAYKALCNDATTRVIANAINNYY